ncbi:MAG: glycine oxidase ThiO [Gemmatimonadales bacterium]
MATPDVLVVGGGIIGAACARALAVAGASVEIVDSGTEPGIATQAAAGMLAPLSETQRDDPVLGLAVRARDGYRTLVPTLEEEAGVSVHLETDGILKVAFTEAEEDSARAAVAWQRQQGLNSEWLTASELRERAAGVSPDARGALLAPEDGSLEPLSLLEALLVSATKRGATLVRGTQVTGLQREGQRVTGVHTSAGDRTAGAVVIAAGAWAGKLMGLPRPLSVEPIRGQMLAFDRPNDEFCTILYGAGGYVLCRGDELLAGSTMEHAGFDSTVTTAGRTTVHAKAARLIPRLADATPRRAWAGLRPVTPDGNAIVGKDPDVQGLYYAAGHGRNGVLFAGLTGEVIASLYTGHSTEYDLTPLDPARFWQF